MSSPDVLLELGRLQEVLDGLKRAHEATGRRLGDAQQRLVMLETKLRGDA